MNDFFKAVTALLCTAFSFVFGNMDGMFIALIALIVLDYISGMTDVYALDLYRKINGMSLPDV